MIKLSFTSWYADLYKQGDPDQGLKKYMDMDMDRKRGTAMAAAQLESAKGNPSIEWLMSLSTFEYLMLCTLSVIRGTNLPHTHYLPCSCI